MWILPVERKNRPVSRLPPIIVRAQSFNLYMPLRPLAFRQKTLVSRQGYSAFEKASSKEFSHLCL